ncbi:MAG: hypothetical protein QOE11_2000 [Solirubrobacteraceae bacterium]|jgi:hypothetical protein|nr:hypothetical protein [Solirubrobacteraceae bacterium]
MVRQVDAQRRMPLAALAAVVALAAGAAGCGGGGDFANDPRPAAPITVSAAISPTRVSISPARFGAGAIELIASNQTSRSQRVTLRSQGVGQGAAQRLEQSTGPINPGDTASLKADVTRGSYVVTARSSAIAPATMVVGAPRRGGTDSLLQP